MAVARKDTETCGAIHAHLAKIWRDRGLVMIDAPAVRFSHGEHLISDDLLDYLVALLNGVA